MLACLNVEFSFTIHTYLAIRCFVRVFVVALGRLVRCVRHPCGARHMHLRFSVAGVRPPLVGRSPPKDYRQAHLQRTCLDFAQASKCLFVTLESVDTGRFLRRVWNLFSSSTGIVIYRLPRHRGAILWHRRHGTVSE